MKPRHQLILIAIGVILFGFAATKMFGTTVSAKFSAANASVMSQVSFGGGGDFAASTYVPPAPARSTAPVAPVPRNTHTDARVDALSTFAIDVDTGSYTIARRAIEGGWMPAPNSVRVEEFVNYFGYEYPTPDAAHTAAVQFEAAPSPFSTDGHTYMMRIGLQAGGLQSRPQAHLTFLVDVSGSMGSADRLPLAQQSIRTAVAALRPTDRVAIVTYSGGTDVVLPSTPAAESRRITAAVDRLTAGGGTAMGSGMQLAYEIAVEHTGPNRVSRVIVMSDGDANIGARHSGDILSSVRSKVEEGVTLSTVGFGTGNYNDQMMEQLANAGNGNYVYIDSGDEVPLVFRDRLDSMLYVVAKDVKVQVEFDADAVVSWRQLGYENRQLAAHEFRDDRVDAGEMGAGHQVTALYEVQLRPDLAAAAPIATARFRHKKPFAYAATEATTTFHAGAVTKRLGESSDDLRFQAAVANYAMYLRGDAEANLEWIEEIASSAHAGRPERLRFLELVRRTGNVERRL